MASLHAGTSARKYGGARLDAGRRVRSGGDDVHKDGAKESQAGNSQLKSAAS
jgi:hypothetical protein